MRAALFILTLIVLPALALAQIDSTLLKRVDPDTTRRMNMDAVYNRPFLQVGKLPVSVGGYVEAHYEYIGTEGISEGHSFSIPRMTLFVASSIHRRIRFLSELEIEEGGKELSIEFAAVDFNLHPLFNLRGGVIMNPIGAFNQNHDGPKWEFVNRPVAMTAMLPATWSNVGFGLYGRRYQGQWAAGYEFYLTNGFDDRIINNTEGRTFLPASKLSKERFEESSNGRMLTTAKAAIRNNKIGEIGLSYMGGIYNKFVDDGIRLDDKRRMAVYAVDFNTTLPKTNTYIVGEWAFVRVDVPDQMEPFFGERQQGGFIDIVQPVLRTRLLGFDNAVVNVAVRMEYTDWNYTTNEAERIADDFRGIVPGLSFRPTAQTVLRVNYRYGQRYDLFGNGPERTGGIQFGVSSYF